MFDKFFFKYLKISLIFLISLSIDSKTSSAEDVAEIDRLINIIENKGVN